jgi:hypothetical protein
MHRYAALAILTILSFTATLAFGEQRALLVGVGKYAVPGIDLPGIDLDLERMNETLNLMGFEDSQIRHLLDERATSDNVIREMKTWLTRGVEKDDRVVFYYSGHGSNTPDFNGDESDGVDEVLVTHDVKRVRIEGRAALSGVVDDDTLASLIDNIPSENIWIIVDACHSGTVTRSFMLDNASLGNDAVFAKSFTYTGMPESEQFVFDREFEKDGEPNFVSMSAAGDNEKAIGTSQGGVFTIGLSKAITEAARTGESMTVIELRDKAAAYIREHVEEARVHNPQVTGSQQLANGAWDLIKLADGINGPNRNKLTAMVEEQNNAFELTANKQVFALDEAVELSMDIPMDGYLNIVTVDSQDNATVLFPNQYHDDNAVSAGKFTIPTEQMDFELPAAEPLGSTLVVGFLTSDAVNFYAKTLDGRDENGIINVDFTPMSHAATRAIKVAPKKKQMYASQLEIDVVE